MGEVEVAVVAMPWNQLAFPSIQIGILKRCLEEAGISAAPRSLYLAAMQHFASSGDDAAEVADYDAVVTSYSYGLGDWIFTVPPYREANPDRDAAYLDYLRTAGVTQDVIR